MPSAPSNPGLGFDGMPPPPPLGQRARSSTLDIKGKRKPVPKVDEVQAEVEKLEVGKEETSV